MGNLGYNEEKLKEKGMLDTIKSTIGLDKLGEPWASIILFGGVGVGVWQGSRLVRGKKLGFGDGGYYLEGSGSTPQQSRFSQAAKMCAGRPGPAFRKCMSAKLKGTGSGLSGLSGGGRPRKKARKTKKRGGGGLSGMSPAMRKQQSKMSSCAAKWRSSGKRGKYKTFMSKCLKG